MTKHITVTLTDREWAQIEYALGNTVADLNAWMERLKPTQRAALTRGLQKLNTQLREGGMWDV